MLDSFGFFYLVIVTLEHLANLKNYFSSIEFAFTNFIRLSLVTNIKLVSKTIFAVTVQ